MVVGVHHLEHSNTPDLQETVFLQEQPTNCPQAFVSECLRAAAVFRADVYWPGRELEQIAKRAGEFLAQGVKLVLAANSAVLAQLEDKLAFSKDAGQFGISTPETFEFKDLPSFDSAYTSIRNSGERVCFKPRTGIFGRGFRVVREHMEIFEDLFADPGYRIDLEDARRRFGSRVTFQPMLAMPWLSGIEWSVDCFRSTDGKRFVAVPRSKVSGDAQMVCLDSEVVEAARTLSNGFRLRGLFNCQFKVHRGRLFALEVNARPAGGVGLCEHTGLNLPELALRDALGLDALPISKPREIRATSTPSWSISGLAQPESTDASPAFSSSKTSKPDVHDEESRTITAHLPGSQVVLRQTSGSWAIGDLVSVAGRRGALRPFLLVSKVLGKHLPVTPTHAAASHAALAEALDIDMDGPVLFVGMAETATGLGWGVYDFWSRRAGRTDSLYIHSTRYIAPGHGAIPFEEVHSHAPGQSLCRPLDPELSDLFNSAKTLVVVDDELTSGRTAAALQQALSRAGLPIQRAEAVALVAAHPPQATERGGDLFGWSVTSLARAVISVTQEADRELGASLNQRTVEMQAGCGLSRWGRLGARVAPTPPPQLVQNISSHLESAAYVTLIGSGECMHPAFVLGKQLETLGHSVLLQATTRSPIALGGPISSTLTCADGLGSGVPFYLHNPPTRDTASIVLYERGAKDAAQELAATLGGMSLEVWDA